MSNQLISSRELTMTYNPKTECFQGYDFKIPKYFVDQKSVLRLSKNILSNSKKNSSDGRILDGFCRSSLGKSMSPIGDIGFQRIKKKPKNILLSIFNKNQYNDGFVKNGKIYLKPRKKLNKNRKNKIWDYRHKNNKTDKTDKTNQIDKTDKTNEINIFRTINKKLTKKNNGFRFARDNLKKTKKYIKNLKG